MKQSRHNYLVSLVLMIAVAWFASCSTPKDVAYVQDA